MFESHICRGDVCFVEFNSNEGSIQSGARPAVVVQNNIGNKYSPTVLVVPLTSKSKKPLPTHVILPRGEAGLPQQSTLMAEQIQVVNKTQIKSFIGTLSERCIKQMNEAVRASLAL